MKINTRFAGIYGLHGTREKLNSVTYQIVGRMQAEPLTNLDTFAYGQNVIAYDLPGHGPVPVREGLLPWSGTTPSFERVIATTPGDVDRLKAAVDIDQTASTKGQRDPSVWMKLITGIGFYDADQLDDIIYDGAKFNPFTGHSTLPFSYLKNAPNGKLSAAPRLVPETDISGLEEDTEAA